MVEGGLQLALRPVLPAGFFDDQNCVSFRFLNRCRITYHNPKRLDTYSQAAVITRMQLSVPGEGTIAVDGDHLEAPYAEWVRSGRVEKMDVWIGTKGG
jgi:hypothetical protein